MASVIQQNAGLNLQTIDFSVPNPSATQNLSLPLYQGAGFRSDFSTWSLLQNGGFMKFNLSLGAAMPVSWSMNVCASLVNNQSNNPITISVNGNAFVSGYSDHNANFHEVSWVIPANLLQAGNNEIIVSLDASASTQLFIKAVSVDQAILKTETINLSIPNPSLTQHLSLPLYQGAGFRSDFSTWSLLVNGGFMKFNLELSAPIDVNLSLSLCSALVNGVANSPATVYVNGQTFWSTNITSGNFGEVSKLIPAALLNAGSNAIQLQLDASAIGQLFINQITVSGT